MSAEGATTTTSVAAFGGATRRLADLASLSKVRLNALTVFAVLAGWWAAVGSAGDPGVLAVTLLGAALVAAGSSALNQVVERERDALMARTAGRPLPAGRVAPSHALAFGLGAGAAGIGLLAVGANLLTAALAALCLGWYVLVYTPLKTRTSLNTIAGTLCGALPPMMGVAAATGRLTIEAWFLASLLLAWQLPHFLSIAWLHRRDYLRAGFVMLPSVPGGEASTARQAIVQSVVTVAVSLLPAPTRLAGATYGTVALAAGVVLLGAAVAFAVARTDAAARRLLRVSVLHLPIVLAAFALDRT